MWKLDIEIYEKWGKDVWAQAKYLVHGHDDVLWTNDLDEAISFLKASAVAVSKLSYNTDINETQTHHG